MKVLVFAVYSDGVLKNKRYEEVDTAQFAKITASIIGDEEGLT